MAKIQVLTDLKVELDPPSHVTRYVGWITKTWGERLEAQERALNEWARDLEKFFRDHRSQDPVSISVVRIHEEQCSHCYTKWEEDPETGEPVCCGAAQEEWRESREERTA